MRVPVEWLKEYVTITPSPEAIAKQLTMAGLEVVAIHDVEGQPVLDIEVTPNRADCLSVVGIAREAAAITGGRFRPPRPPADGPRRPARSKAARPVVRIEDRAGCARYIGRLLTGARVGPSPAWMQRRLLACGVRPINNVVDITNYVLFEYGQPLHAFDFSRLAQGTIVVRRARRGESMTTLDGVGRSLPAEALVIADAKQPVAVAGVMGGVGSEVTGQTHELLLESAWFDPVRVRRTARQLGVTTESSYRFERGVDPAGVEAGSRRAAELLRELAGATEVAVADAGGKPAARRAIPLEPGRLSRWLGVRLDPASVRTSLVRLSCRVAHSGASSTLQVIPPSFRQDLTQPADLYEELARLTGYEKIPSTLPSGALPTPSDAAGEYWRLQSLKCLCASFGLTEAITWSLVSESELARCGLRASEAVRLTNPLSQDHAYLRPSLLPGLLQAVRRNVVQNVPVNRLSELPRYGVRLFELGQVVAGGREHMRLGLVLYGWWKADYRYQGETADFLVLKGIIEALVGRLCQGTLSFTGARCAWAEPGQSAAIQLGGRPLGEAGLVSQAIARALDIERPIVFAELSVESLLGAKRSTPRLTAPPIFPPVRRDLSFFIADDVPFEAVEQTIRETAGPAADRVDLLDYYTTGKQVPAGKHSLTFSMEYRDPSRTLTAAEAEAVHQRIGRALVERFGAVLR